MKRRDDLKPCKSITKIRAWTDNKLLDKIRKGITII